MQREAGRSPAQLRRPGRRALSLPGWRWTGRGDEPEAGAEISSRRPAFLPSSAWFPLHIPGADTSPGPQRLLGRCSWLEGSPWVPKKSVPPTQGTL